MPALYDKIGKRYSSNRQTDPRLEKQLHQHLNGARNILNIGAGTGSYEPANVELTALEPSTEMISQRSPDACPVIQGFAEELPFEDNSFSHVLTVLSLHHWSDRPKAFAEINRVGIDHFVALTWTIDAGPFWLTRDYFPEIFEMDRKTFPGLDDFGKYFDEVALTPLLIPADCMDGFLAAYWKRPEAYLDQNLRNSISSFSKFDETEGLQELEADLQSGVWQERNKELLELDEIDAGYRILTARIRK